MVGYASNRSIEIGTLEHIIVIDASFDLVMYISTLTLRYPSFLGSFQHRLFFVVVPFFWGSFALKRSFPLSYVNLQPQPSRLKEPSKALRLSFSCGSLSAPGSGMGSRSPILICMHKESLY